MIVRSGRLPPALSLFSGAGGMDLGVRWAGYDVLGEVEVDPHCCETLRAAAFRDQRKSQVIQTDIRSLDPEALMTTLGLRSGELALLFGGPPCQSFSQIGKRGFLNDDRGLLLFEVARFAKVLRPHAILIEQVKGLTSAEDQAGIRGGVFESLVASLRELGYDVWWRVLNAADYGVAQTRRRVFVVASEPGVRFEFPAPTRSSEPNSLFPLPLYSSVGQTIEGLGPPQQGPHPFREDGHVDVTPEGDRRRIQGVPEGKWLAAQAHLPASQRCNLSRKDTTKFRRLSRSLPSLTLRCGEIFFHPTEDRYLTPREYMRLHGYPDTYILKGPIRGRSGRVRHLDQHRQVANSVPPPLAHALAESIRRAQTCHSSLRSSATR
jgi:DNA (cytosine-5)-methyltransferase 1